MGKAYIVVSGKGGVGKTTISTSLSILLAKQGSSVLLLEMDIGLRCIDQVMGIEHEATYDLEDLLQGDRKLKEVVTTSQYAPSLHILLAPQLMSVNDIEKKNMARLIKLMKKNYQYVIVDCPAGIGRGIENVIDVADEAIIVTTPDDVAVRDAQKMKEVLCKDRNINAQLIINRVDKGLIWDGEMKRPGEIARMLDVNLLGVIPNHNAIYLGLLRQIPAACVKNLKIKRAFHIIVQRFLKENTKLPRYCK